MTGAVQEILHRPSPPPDVIETPRDYVSALENYRERLPAIEAEVLNSLEPKARELIRQAGANDYHGCSIWARRWHSAISTSSTVI